MTKRKLAVIPLLVASIMMLVSSVLPHHHHGALICFTSSHCSIEQAEKTCHHDHDSNPCQHKCEVKQLFETDGVKQSHHAGYAGDDGVPYQHFLPLFILAGVDQAFFPAGDAREVPPVFYRERLHPIAWSVACAGRAPPIVIA